MDSTLRALPLDFEQQARERPGSIALELDGKTLTYRELDERSLALARFLRANGVTREALCAICVERSFAMVVGIYGILRAGAAYVPLDPGYPKERLAFMAEDCGASIVLTQASVLDRLPKTNARVVCLDRDEAEIARATGSLDALAPPDAGLAYMIYTSGSTGRPKGALNHHAGVRNRLAWMQDAYGLTADDRVLHKTPFSFDVSVWELFWPLQVGARMVIARPEGHRDPAYLSQLIEDTGVTVLHFVPSMLQVFLESPALETRCRSVKHVFCSGEALPYELTRRFFARLPHARLHNLYGPTEAAVDVSFHECTKDDVGPSVPIGRPVAHTTLVVLDEDGTRVPDGTPGELHIGGVQVGRGYHGRPELTAERFVPAADGARLYRTGDLARIGAHGELEYLGRLDHQVKVRGFRIELGEIEHALDALPGVSASAVATHRDRHGDVRLVGYVVARGGAVLEPHALRTALGTTLPEHMVPSAIVVLDALPLSPTGKLDRNRLPAPALDRDGRTVEGPRDHVELALHGIWEALFDVGPIGITDDFFDLGGTSVQAVRLVAEVERTLGRQLAPAEVARTPTIASMAATLRDSDALPPASSLVLLQRGSTRPLFLVHPIGGNVLCYVALARRLGPEQTVYGLQARGLDGREPPLDDNDRIVDHYLDLIRTTQPKGPYHLGGYSNGGMVAYVLAQRLVALGEDVELLFNLDGRAQRDEMLPVMLEKTHHFDDATMAFWMLVVLGRTVGLEVDAELAEFEALDPEARVDHLLAHLQRHGIMPPGVGHNQMRAAFEVYKANMRSLGTTHLEPYAGPMVLVKAARVLPDRPNAPTPPPWSWEQFTTRVEEHSIDCNHFTLLWGDNVDRVANVLRPYLERAR